MIYERHLEFLYKTSLGQGPRLFLSDIICIIIREVYENAG